MKIKLLFILFILSASFGTTQAQEQSPKSPPTFKQTYAVTFANGEKAFLSGFLDNIELQNNTPDHLQHAWITGLPKDSIQIRYNGPGKFNLYVLDTLVAQFEIIKKDDKLTCTLPDRITLPFNYVVSAPAGQKITICSLDGKPVAHKTVNQKGFLFFQQDSAYFSNKFLCTHFPHGFTQIKVFEQRKAPYAFQLKQHLIPFKPTDKPIKAVLRQHGPSQYNENIVHNIKKNTFYAITSVAFHLNGEKYPWLLIYDAGEDKSTAQEIPVTGNRKALATDIFLNDKGNPVIVISQQDPKTYDYSNVFYLLSENNTLEKTHYPEYPRYRFKNFVVDGGSWIIPTYHGIALTPGAHTFKVRCTDKNGTVKTSFESFEVLFQPKQKYFYQIVKTGDTSQHSGTYYPDGMGTKAAEFRSMNLKECDLSVDGSAPIPYSYQDPDRLKSIGYADWENEAEKQKALENVPVRPGLEPDENPWSNVLTFFPFQHVTGPINLWEGPFQELRYQLKQISGKYPNWSEARKHCEDPVKYDDKYVCYKVKIVSVCPEKYDYSMENGKAVTDTAALYCKKGKKAVYMPHGQNILLVISAPGYRAQTIELSKKDLQVSDIHLNGTVSGPDRKPIKGAKILLVGQHSSFVTDSTGHYTLTGKAHGNEPYTETINVSLEPIGVEVFNDTLGMADTIKYFGIVADGFSTLKLHIKLNGIDPATVVVRPPELGNFITSDSGHRALVFQNQQATLEYVPPAYLRYYNLNKQLDIDEAYKGNHGMSGNIWGAEVPVSIAYEDKDGNPGTMLFNIMVVRPPVMLIHGFTGDEKTWEHLAVQLRNDKFDAIIREYYKGPIETSAIENQAQKLNRYISELQHVYFKNHILLNRVDIVAHSMGGLISRYYISNMPKYGKKAGIVIPYDVKLSRKQLAENRFKEPVIINDVRKLIMVGTPNHGASWIDEKIGALNALFSQEHQLANEELRYDSPFLAQLNAGEAEGRHLDPNVQYAVLYGLRRRSQLYPFDNVLHPVETALRKLVNDDGVVSKQSAQLNGVMSYHFPENLEKYSYGYLHTPLLANLCEGDASITNDSLVFSKIEELLQEDIPRLPLKNSLSEIFRAKGRVYMRYYATQHWIPVRTPLSPDNIKTLPYNFCRIKTLNGTASLGFLLNGHHWGTLNIEPNTTVYYEMASPEFVRIYLQQGKARFLSRKQNGNSFEVVMGDKTGEKWYAFNPKARVKDLNTDFIVEHDSITAVHSLSGIVMMTVDTNAKSKPVSKTIAPRKGYLYTSSGKLKVDLLPDTGWWTHIDTTFLPDEQADTLSYALPKKLVHIRFTTPYLPVAGFSSLQIKIDRDTLQKDSLLSYFRTIVRLSNASALPFVSITNPDGTTDSTGTYQTDITLREPKNEDIPNFEKLPLKAKFHIQLVLSGTHHVVYEKDTVLPLGMTLLYGQVTGPDGKPRYQPSPPYFSGAIYHLLSRADTNGRFYILFNTTSYLNNIKKLSDYASSPDHQHSVSFELTWPKNCTFPLNYKIPDSLQKQFIPGMKLKIGNHGYVDLLTPEEQEQRVKQMATSFIGEMHLKPENKQQLINKLHALEWIYNAKVKTPVYLEKEGKTPTMSIPLPKQVFWNNAFYDTTGNSYVGIFQAIGQFLAQDLCFDKQKAGHSMQHQSSKPAPDSMLIPGFNPEDYISFEKTNSLFFQTLMVNFLKKQNHPFLTKSLYSFVLLKKDQEQEQNTGVPAYSNSNRQLQFLIAYYHSFYKTDPAKVYADFLLNKKLYETFSGNGMPAMTFKQWLISKKAFYTNTYFVHTSDPLTFARKEHILTGNLKAILFPQSEFSQCSLEINGKNITGFEQIPALTIDTGQQITVIRGKFRIQIPALGVYKLVDITPVALSKKGIPARFEMKNDTLLLPVLGNFHFLAPLTFKIPAAVIQAQSNNFVIRLDGKRAVISVYEGTVTVKSIKEELTVAKGQYISVGKTGNISKIKETANPDTQDTVLLKIPPVPFETR